MPKSLPPLDEVLKFGAPADTQASIVSATPQTLLAAHPACTKSFETFPDKCPLTTPDAATSTSTQEDGDQPLASNTPADPVDAEELYLIAHIVRGQPTFDVAIKLQIGEEDGWITATYGHRAYPYWHWNLNALDILDEWGIGKLLFKAVPPPPPGWRDHFHVNDILKSRSPRPVRGVPINLDLGDIEI